MTTTQALRDRADAAEKLSPVTDPANLMMHDPERDGDIRENPGWRALVGLAQTAALEFIERDGHRIEVNRGAKGRFTRKSAVAQALESGQADALAGFSREEIRREAKRRGLDAVLKPGTPDDVIKDALAADEAATPAKPEAPKVAKPRAVKAAVGAQDKSPAAVQQRLQSVGSEAEAHAYLDSLKLNKAELTGLATTLDVPTGTKAQIHDSLVKVFVRGRIVTNAVMRPDLHPARKDRDRDLPDAPRPQSGASGGGANVNAPNADRTLDDPADVDRRIAKLESEIAARKLRNMSPTATQNALRMALQDRKRQLAEAGITAAPTAPKPTRAPRAPKPSTFDASALSARLDTETSVPRAIEMMDGLSGSDLHTLAEKVGLPGHKSMAKTKLRREIADFTVGARGSWRRAVTDDSAGAPRTQTSTAGGFDASATATALDTVTSREDARAALAGLTGKQLLDVAKASGMTWASPKTKKGDLVEELISLKVGGRLTFDAMREEAASGTSFMTPNVDLAPGRAVSAFASPPHMPAPTAQEAADVDAVVAAYRRLARDNRDLVSLTKLRAALPADMSRQRVDAALRRMALARGVSVVPQSNQKTLTAEDRLAMVRIGNEDKSLVSIDLPMGDGGGVGGTQVPASIPRPMIKDQVLQAFSELSSNPNELVSLVRLRARLPHVLHDELSEALKELDRERAIQLEPEPNQKILTPEIRAAGVLLGGKNNLFMSVRGGVGPKA